MDGRDSGFNSLPLWLPETPTPLDERGKELKRQIYEKMNPRRRKFIDKIGYDQWDPFQEPKQPLDLRKDQTQRTLQQLVDEFMRDNPDHANDEAWRKGARECALGIFQKDDKYQGIFDFCLWYNKLLLKEAKNKS